MKTISLVLLSLLPLFLTMTPADRAVASPTPAKTASATPTPAATTSTVTKSVPTVTLPNGAPFFGSEDKSLPRNIYLLSFQGGPALFSAEKQGVVSLLLELYNEGPKDLSLKEYNQQLFDLGAEINFNASPGVFEVIVKTPPAEQAKVFDLVRRTLKSPRTDKQEFEKLHAAILASLRSKFENMRTVIYYFAPLDLMNYQPEVLTGQSSATSFEKITYKDLKDNLTKVLKFENLFVSYIGSTPANDAKAMVAKVFESDLKKPYVRPSPVRLKPPQVSSYKYTVIDKQAATDNQVLMFFPQSVQRDSSEWIEAKLTMDLLGGGLHGALGKTLRVERGLTYGAQSGFNNRGLPYWFVWTFGGNQQIPGLLKGIPEVNETFQNTPISATVLSESKARALNDFKNLMELPQDLLLQKSWYYLNGYDATFLDRYEKEIQEIDVKQLNLFKMGLQTKNAAVYLMGDQKVLLPVLESLGVPRDQVRVVRLAEIQ